MNRFSVLRILDANFNRLKEAFRVIEEITRLVHGHKQHALTVKKLRHEAQRIMNAFPVSYRKLLRARDSENDVGRASRIQDKKKIQLHDLLVSNFKRAEESARVLEEFSKLISIKTSGAFQRLRFKIYSFEKKFLA